MARAKKKDAAAELAERMLQTLQGLRRQDPAAYPPTLQRLAELTDPQAAPDVIDKAIKKKPFKDHALIVLKNNPRSPVGLAADVAQLAASPLVLEAVLETLCTPATPLWSVAKVAGKVVKDLKKPLAESIKQQIKTSTLPASVGVRLEKNKPNLFLHRLPPPPPPRPPAVVLAEKLVHVLETQRGLGEGSYPVPLDRLRELMEAAPRLLKQAFALEPFKTGAVLAVPKDPATPVALAGDAARLAGSRTLLEFLLDKARKPGVQAFPLKALAKPLAKGLQPLFEEAVNRQFDHGSNPPSVGALWIKTRHLFLQSDVQGRHAAPALAPGPDGQHSAGADLAGRFEEVFAHLDRQAGGRNFVNLVDLRKALPAPRAAFDDALFQLRQAGQYSLSAAEGRHGISAEEQEAGIREEGSLLLFVSRNAR
jgi:hypothetical protein